MVNQKPNLLILLADQMRWDVLGCSGAQYGVTPHLDRLAGSGTYFSHAFTPQPVCGPARSCLQSGRYASESGSFSNHKPLPPGEARLAPALEAAGYQTAYIGKWHLAGDQYRHASVPPEGRGGWNQIWKAIEIPEYSSNGYFGKVYDEEGEELTAETNRPAFYTDLALEAMGKMSAESPWVTFVSYVEPHPQPYHKLYQGPERPNRPPLIRDYLLYEGPHRDRERFQGAEPPGELKAFASDWAKGGADYLAATLEVDRQVGRLLDWLEANNQRENTLIVFTSDHGCHFHSRNRNDGKCSPHEASIRIPLILDGPGFRGMGKREELVSLIDLPATWLRAAGVAVPEVFRGRSLQDILEGWGTPQLWSDTVYVETSGVHLERAIRTRRWKYSVVDPEADFMQQARGKAYQERYLYDLREDPWEVDNRITDSAHAEIRRELRNRLQSVLRELNDSALIVDHIFEDPKEA